MILGWSLRRTILAHPNERSSHTVPTPHGGGIAIVVLTLAAFILSDRSQPMLVWAAGGLAIAIVSWIDDLSHVPKLIRFAIHLGAAAAGAYACGTWKTIALDPLGTLPLGVFAFPLTVIWIVGLTNAWNFMDGIDGIAGLCAVVAAIFVTMVAPPAAVIAIPLAASTAGFLTANWPPARIFMGDVGSTFLGYTLALLPLGSGVRDGHAVWIALLPVWPFVFDTVFTIIRRLRLRENVLAAHRRHLYQRLVISGWPHVRVTILYGVLTAVGGAAALAIRREVPALAVIAPTAICAAGLWFLTISVERRAR